MKKKYFLPLLLVLPGIKFIATSGLDFSSMDFYKTNIKQSLKPPISGVFGLDLNKDEVEKFVALRKVKDFKDRKKSTDLNKYISPESSVNNRDQFINRLCVTQGKVYSFDNLIKWDGGKPSKKSNSYTQQLIEDLLVNKKHITRQEANWLWGVVNNWDDVLRINVPNLLKVIEKLSSLLNEKEIKDKESVTSAAGRPYNELDAVNIILQMSLTALYEIDKLLSKSK